MTLQYWVYSDHWNGVHACKHIFPFAAAAEQTMHLIHLTCPYCYRLTCMQSMKRFLHSFKSHQVMWRTQHRISRTDVLPITSTSIYCHISNLCDPAHAGVHLDLLGSLTSPAFTSGSILATLTGILHMHKLSDSSQNYSHVSSRPSRPVTKQHTHK